jgi:DNA-directed RNA polymerase subunit M/transcription elongation factor TFIIS
MVVLHNSEGIVERVQCRTCGSEHKYKPEKKKMVKKAAKKKTKSRAKSRKPDPAAIFEQLAGKFQDKDPVPYTMQGSYKADDVIDHKTFGKGFVTEVSYQKMEVTFVDGPRILVCDR